MNSTLVAICVHHKPWLVMSTLVSLMLQDYRDFDLLFIFNTDPSRKYPQTKKFGINSKVSSYEKAVEVVCNIGFKHKVVKYQNDDALDSGAWLKMIRDKLWVKYDEILMIQEGTLFTSEFALGKMVDFIKSGNDFVASGHEKRILSKPVFTSYFMRSIKRAGNSNVNVGLFKFHDKMINKSIECFCREPRFKKLYQQWQPKEHKTKTKNLVSPDVKFFKEEKPAYFGCGCNHIVSKKFMKSMRESFSRYNIFDDILGMPFSATALEVAWGFWPMAYGQDKYFTNCMHRVRKNHRTYAREDDIGGMIRYLKKYHDVTASPNKRFIKIKQNIKGLNDKYY